MWKWANINLKSFASQPLGVHFKASFCTENHQVEHCLRTSIVIPSVTPTLPTCLYTMWTASERQLKPPYTKASCIFYHQCLLRMEGKHKHDWVWPLELIISPCCTCMAQARLCIPHALGVPGQGGTRISSIPIQLFVFIIVFTVKYVHTHMTYLLKHTENDSCTHTHTRTHTSASKLLKE